MSKYTIKSIFLSNNNWENFVCRFKSKIRSAITITISKLLTCRETVIGYNHYKCSNPYCTFTKKISFTCKCKACSCCGKKDIEIWMHKNTNILPNTSWQHITFTMPQELWDFFWINRDMFNDIIKLAVSCIQKIANDKNVTPGVFVALHTFKRNIEKNVHIHLSTTTGGITKDLTKWKKLYFYHKTLKSLWKYKIITLFRNKYKNKDLQIPSSLQKQLNHCYSFYNFLDCLYNKNWVVHCGKPSNDHKRNLEYFSRYTKRPPIAESKIKHYDGQFVTFTFRNHKTGEYQNEKITIFQFIKRFIQHIPDVGFRMIRYYGFLANRIRTKALNIVTKLLGSVKITIPTQTNYAALLYKSFGINPFICPSCGNDLILFHREIIQTSNLSIPTALITSC